MNRSDYVSKATHYRRGHIICHIMTGEKQVFPSISKAKRRSRQMQKEEKAIIVKVEGKKRASI